MGPRVSQIKYALQAAFLLAPLLTLIVQPQNLWAHPSSLCEILLLSGPASSKGVDLRQELYSLESFGSLNERELSFQAIGAQHNREFIQSLHQKVRSTQNHPGSSSLPRFYFHGDLAVLKDLNDRVIRNKDLVTRLVDYHKNIFVAELQDARSYPLIQQNLLVEYSDFKSLRLGFAEYSPQLEEELEQLLVRANTLFAAVVRRMKLQGDSSALRGLSADPKLWFVAGSAVADPRPVSWLNSELERGELVADLAGIAARFGREKTAQSRQVQLTRFEEIEGEIEKNLANIHRIYAKIQNELAPRLPMLFESWTPEPGQSTDLNGSSDSFKIPHISLIEILLKTKLSAEEAESFALQGERGHKKALKLLLERYRQAVARRFQISESLVSSKDMALLKEYINSIDRLMPGLVIEERQSFAWSRAQGGLVSLDFAGQNARNFEQAMMALASQSPHTPILQTIHNLREAEKGATENLNKKKQFWERAALEVFADQPDVQLLFSGDDGLMAPRQLELSHKLKLIDFLRFFPQSGSLRMTFLPPGLKGDKLSEAMVFLEGLEKHLRQSLSGQISDSEIRQALIVPELLSPLQEGEGFQIRLWLDKKSFNPSLESHMAQLLEEHLKAQQPNWPLPLNIKATQINRL